MGKFNSDDHYIYYCGHESLKRNKVALTVNKSPKCSAWLQSQKQQNDLCFQGKPFNITVIQVYVPTTNAKEHEVEQSNEDLQDLLELTAKKQCPFHWKRLECKSKKLRDTWRNRQLGLGVQNEAGQRLTEFCQQNALVKANQCTSVYQYIGIYQCTNLY